jgi:hypothetical protein
MKDSSYKTLLAVACGMIALCAGIWAVACIMDGNHTFAILLGCVTAFFALACHVQRHDARIAAIREDWRRAASGDQAL